MATLPSTAASVAPPAATASAASAASSSAKRYTLADLEGVAQPWDDTRYEIIDGELFVSTQPSNRHQFTCHKTAVRLDTWNEQNGWGVVLPAPGLIFADDDNAAPDVLWVSHERYRSGM